MGGNTPYADSFTLQASIEAGGNSKIDTTAGSTTAVHVFSSFPHELMSRRSKFGVVLFFRKKRSEANQGEKWHCLACFEATTSRESMPGEMPF